MKKTNRIFTILIFIFLYIPMAVLVVASFNTGKDIANFEGFTLHRYVELFQDEHLLQLLRNSLVISIMATSFSHWSAGRWGCRNCTHFTPVALMGASHRAGWAWHGFS